MGKFTFHPVKSLQSDPKLRMLCLFGIEGFLLQYAVSLYTLANNLYATNLGATDTQIGLVQMVPNMVAGICMIPVGFLANRTKTSRTVPFVLALFLSAAYFAYGSVPLFGEHRMTAFFVFLGMTVGGIALYNAQWQTFFGDAVEPDLRNSVFTFRSRCLFFVGIVVPLLCGNIMTLMPDTEGKLIVLRIFFYIAGVCMLLQALVLRRIPCPPPEGWRHGCLSWRLVLIYSIHSINKMSNPGPLRQTGNTNPRRFINAGGSFFLYRPGRPPKPPPPPGAMPPPAPPAAEPSLRTLVTTPERVTVESSAEPDRVPDAAYPLMSPPLQVPPLYRV